MIRKIAVFAAFAAALAFGAEALAQAAVAQTQGSAIATETMSAASVVRVDLTGGGASQSLTLPKGKSAIVELPVDARDVLVTNPQVADAVLRSPRRIYVMGVKSGQTWAIEGVFREVKPPERLVYTWGFPENPEFGEPGETTVTVDFRERGKATEVTVTHEGFTNAVARSEHNKGWIGCLDRLGSLVTRN